MYVSEQEEPASCVFQQLTFKPFTPFLYGYYKLKFTIKAFSSFMEETHLEPTGLMINDPPTTNNQQPTQPTQPTNDSSSSSTVSIFSAFIASQV